MTFYGLKSLSKKDSIDIIYTKIVKVRTAFDEH